MRVGGWVWYTSVHFCMILGYGEGLAGWTTEEGAHLQTPHNGKIVGHVEWLTTGVCVCVTVSVHVCAGHY